MRLRQLTGLAREELESEYAELLERIAYYKGILADEKKLLGVIKEEILIVKEKYAYERRTEIGIDYSDITNEDLIPNVDTVISMTKLGYIKRMNVDNFHSQNRGGKGIKGMATINDDYITELFMTTTHSEIMFFTNFGRAYKVKGYEIPEGSRISRGTAVVNIIQLMPDEKVSAVIPLDGIKIGDENKDTYFVMATKNGTIKKTPISAFANIRKSGIIAIDLRDDDKLIDVKITDNTDTIMLFTYEGKSIMFDEKDIRITGRSSMGVRGMRLSEGDKVIAMTKTSESNQVIIVSEKGFGKRTLTSEFRLQSRGGKGIKAYNITDKTGNIAGVISVEEDDELLMINSAGTMIRIRVSEVSLLKRVTSGVKMIRIDDKDDVRVASIAKVKEEMGNGEEDADGENSEEGTEE